VAREKQEKGISLLRSPSPQIKKNSNPNHKKRGEKQTATAKPQQHHSVGDWGESQQNRKENRRARVQKRTREQQEHTVHTLISFKGNV